MRFDYVDIRGKFLPIIPVEIKGKDDWVQFHVFVDTGASQSIFSANFCEILGVNLEDGEKINIMVGDGSFIPAYIHKLDVRFADKEFDAYIGFSKRLGVEFNILGRKDFFENFVSAFDDYHKTLDVIETVK